MKLHGIVVGAGPAGLAAALALGRMRRRALVIDSGEPRNHYTDHLHNFITRDGMSPLEFRRLGRTEAERYPTVEFRDGRVVDAAASEEGVEITMEDGERVTAQRLALAGGIKDTLPAIEGLADLFGKSAFTCPYCDGYEGNAGAIGMICTRERQLAHAAGLMCMLTSDATIFANGHAVTDDELDTARRLGAKVVRDPVARLRADGDVLRAIVLRDGVEVPCDRVFVPMDSRPSNPLAERLGCAMTEAGYIEVDQLGRTSIPRVYAAGDATSPLHQVILAAAAGTRAALAMNNDAINAFELA